MNEKFVKVEILIDTTNPEQLKSLGSLLTTIGSIEVPAPEVKPETPAAPEAPKPAQTKKRTTKPAEPAPAPEAPAEEETKPAEEAKPEAPAEAPAEKKEYKIEEVREKLKEKVNDHREAIKAKLTELGAPNVSSLDPDNYSAFMDFLNGLE